MSKTPRLTSPVRTLPRYFIFAAITTFPMRERMVETATSSTSKPFSVTHSGRYHRPRSHSGRTNSIAGELTVCLSDLVWCSQLPPHKESQGLISR